MISIIARQVASRRMVFDFFLLCALFIIKISPCVKVAIFDFCTSAASVFLSCMVSSKKMYDIQY